MTSLRVVHSTVSADDIGALAREHFRSGRVASCRLLIPRIQRYLELRTASGERYRIAAWRAAVDRPTDLDYEMAFLGSPDIATREQLAVAVKRSCNASGGIRMKARRQV